MEIRIAERPIVFHVPYRAPNTEGTPEASYVDVKADPAWISVLPSCLGWPETQELLRVVNAPTSPLMTLAADQAFVDRAQPGPRLALTSFVTLCYADLARNDKAALAVLARSLQAGLSALLQAASDELQQRLFLEVLLELQPTMFHHAGREGWSLTVFMAASGSDEGEARHTWQIGVTALLAVLSNV